MTSRALTILIKGQFRKILRNRFQARRKTRRAINNPNADFDIVRRSSFEKVDLIFDEKMR